MSQLAVWTELQAKVQGSFILKGEVQLDNASIIQPIQQLPFLFDIINLRDRLDQRI